MAIRKVLLAYSLIFCGCASSARVERMTAVDPPAATSGSAIHFLASYPATLIYALDAASGVGHRDEGYRAWFTATTESPIWLDQYATRRREWTSMRDDSGGGAPSYEVCAWTAADLASFRTCAIQAIPSADGAVLDTALAEADRALQSRWPSLSQHLSSMLPALREGLATESARTLFAILRDEAKLPATTLLNFNLVLVVKPAGNHSHAQQQGEFLLHEVGDDETAGSLLPIAFHEIAHLAHAQSPNRDAMDLVFAQSGDPGLLAANTWDEVVATAFGNGLAASKLDPAFNPANSFYDDTHIDRLAHALYGRWSGGQHIQLGADLARDLVSLVDGSWPNDQRTLRRYLWSFTMYGSDPTLMRNATRGLEYRSASRASPIVDEVPAGDDMPIWAPRIVLLRHDELAERHRLRERVRMQQFPQDSSSQVFRYTENGTIFLIIVAKDDPSLIVAMRSLLDRTGMVQDGWSAIALRAAQ